MHAIAGVFAFIAFAAHAAVDDGYDAVTLRHVGHVVFGEFFYGTVNLGGRATTGAGEFLARAGDNTTATCQVESAQNLAVNTTGFG